MSYNIEAMYTLLLLSIGFIVQIFYIITLIKKNTKTAVILKILSCSTFVIACFLFGNSYRIAAAMFLGYIGDILLGIRRLVKCNKMFFIIGTVFFMAEHIVLIITMLPAMKNNILLCSITETIAFVVLYMIIRPCLKSGNETINVIGIIYMFVLSAMAVSGVNACFESPTINTGLFMIGSLCFVSSDTILVHSNFGSNKAWMHPVSLVLYFIAQSLIALSIII